MFLLSNNSFARVSPGTSPHDTGPWEQALDLASSLVDATPPKATMLQPEFRPSVRCQGPTPIASGQSGFS